MLVQILAAIGVLALLTLVPGPDLAVVTRRSLTGGRAAGAAAAGGVVTGLLVWGGLAVLGLTALLSSAPDVYLGLRVVGAAYLVVLGVQALRSRHDGSVPERHPGRPYVTGLTTNLFNPKIAVFYTAMLPTLAPRGLGAWGMALLVIIHAGLSLTWLTSYAWMLHRAREVFERPRVRRVLDRVTGVVLISFALRLVTEG